MRSAGKAAGPWTPGYPAATDQEAGLRAWVSWLVSHIPGPTSCIPYPYPVVVKEETVDRGAGCAQKFVFKYKGKNVGDRKARNL